MRRKIARYICLGALAYFGVYGVREGDGVPTITVEEQIAQTVDVITNQLQKNKLSSAKRVWFQKRLYSLFL